MDHNWKWVFLGALFIGGYCSIFASSSPDGLMKVAEDQGFVRQSVQYFRGVLPAYHVPGIEHRNLATALSGLMGVIAVFVVLFGASYYLFPSVSNDKARISPKRDGVHR